MIQLVLLWPPPRLSGWVIEYLGTQKLHQRATTNSYLQTFYARQHKSLQLLLNSCQIYKSDITAFQHRKRSVLWSLLLIVTNSGLLATLTLSRWKSGSSNLWDLSPLLFMSCCYELLYVAEHVDLLFEARFRVRFHPHHPHHPKRTQSPNPSYLAQGLHEYRSHRSRRGTAAIWSLACVQRWQSAFHICDKLKLIPSLLFVHKLWQYESLASRFQPRTPFVWNKRSHLIWNAHIFRFRSNLRWHLWGCI